ncbi:hypothetical protein LCGC14_2542340 [marine sediment metagenome]|uniref:Uncharacterized protein n=1 Tax=marine sediment metagenome TaxID=412755 RepID=A0A0F9D1Y1_9ZZZZ
MHVKTKRVIEDHYSLVLGEDGVSIGKQVERLIKEMFTNPADGRPLSIEVEFGEEECNELHNTFYKKATSKAM